MTPLSPFLVLLAAGRPAKVTARLRQVAPPLADALDLPLAPPLDPQDPQAALAGLAAGADVSLPRLVPLPMDPGHGLPAGGHWAEALGAWRQPVLLVVSARQLDSGLPAATMALLERWQVPCVGLLQWGGRWQAGRRRLDALPWLGGLQVEWEQPGTGPWQANPADPWTLRQALALRWRQLQAG
ncbi:MAG: hypothetical protein AB1Z22_10510 [Synechococcaceae cyanobacterium]